MRLARLVVDGEELAVLLRPVEDVHRQRCAVVPAHRRHVGELLVVPLDPRGRAALRADDAEVDVGVGLASARVEALLGLTLGMGRVRDAQHLDAGLVDLFERHALAVGREPEAALAVELLLGDELGNPVRLLVGAAARDRALGALAVDVEDADVVVAHVRDALAIGRQVRVERAIDRELAHGARHAIEHEEMPREREEDREPIGRQIERREARRRLAHALPPLALCGRELLGVLEDLVGCAEAQQAVRRDVELVERLRRLARLGAKEEDRPPVRRHHRALRHARAIRLRLRERPHDGFVELWRDDGVRYDVGWVRCRRRERLVTRDDGGEPMPR